MIGEVGTKTGTSLLANEPKSVTSNGDHWFTFSLLAFHQIRSLHTQLLSILSERWWGICELKQVLVWDSTCNMNCWMNQLFPNKITFIYPFHCTTKSYTLFATLFSNLFSYKSCVTTPWSEKTLITNQKPVRLILSVGMKTKIFLKASFSSWE